MVELKEIRIFTNTNKFSLVTEVNDFIKSTEYGVSDIQYGVSSDLFSSEYSVMIVLETNNKES